MATQTEYVVPVLFEPIAVGDGSSRQWMTPSGFYLDEGASGGGSGINPVVRTSG